MNLKTVKCRTFYWSICIIFLGPIHESIKFIDLYTVWAPEKLRWTKTKLMLWILLVDPAKSWTTKSRKCHTKLQFINLRVQWQNNFKKVENEPLDNKYIESLEICKRISKNYESSNKIQTNLGIDLLQGNTHRCTASLDVLIPTVCRMNTVWNHLWGRIVPLFYCSLKMSPSVSS